MNSVLRLKSINGSPIVEYRDIDGHPVPYQVTIQRRVLSADGGEFRDGLSGWTTISIGEVLRQLQLGGEVCEWLCTRTSVNCSPVVFAAYPNHAAPAYLWNVNA